MGLVKRFVFSYDESYMERKLIYWVAAVLILLVLFFAAMVVFTSRVAQAPEVKTEPKFRGPVGKPYVKGPSGPPPGPSDLGDW